MQCATCVRIILIIVTFLHFAIGHPLQAVPTCPYPNYLFLDVLGLAIRLDVFYARSAKAQTALNSCSGNYPCGKVDAEVISIFRLTRERIEYSISGPYV